MFENKQKIKLLKLTEFLRSESAKDKPVTTSQIISYLNNIEISCDRRTLYKDMDLLIESGANIVKTEFGRENAYYVDENSLSLAEVKILIDAVQAANFVTAEKTKELTEKLLAFAGIRRSEIVGENITFYNNHKHTNSEIFDNIEQIELAVSKKKQVSFYYFDLDEKLNRVYRKEKKRYIEEPVVLVFDDDNYYLVTYNQNYQKSLSYRVDLMDTVEVEDTDVCKETLMLKSKMKKYKEQVFRMFSGDLETVTLEFDKTVLRYVYDKFGEGTEIRHADNDRLKVKVLVETSPAFFGWVFQFGGKVEIISPENVVNEYAKLLDEQLNGKTFGKI